MYEKTTLDNGLRIVTGTMPHTPSVCIAIFVGAGSRYENEAQAGISHFAEHMFFRGTPKRATARAISEAIEGVGGILNAATDKELTIYWCKVAKPHFLLGLEVLVDILRHSRFDAQDMEKERQIIIEEIGLSRDSPSQRVGMLIDELLWPDHPLGRDIAGSRESVTGITREVMLDYLQRQYIPGNMVFAIAGDVRHDEAVEVVGRFMGDWSDRQQPAGYLAYREQAASQLCVERRDTEQAHLCLALPGLSQLHPKRFILDLLNVVLGEGMSSRLFTEIRDRLGLAYSIGSYVEHFLDTGSVTVSASVEPTTLSVAIGAILEQLSRLKEPIPETELTKAREMSKGRLLLRMEDSRSVAGWIGGQEVLTGQILSIEQVLSIIAAITVEDLQQLAREILVGNQLRLAVVGPVVEGEPLGELLRL